jgi:hypothetical protein
LDIRKMIRLSPATHPLTPTEAVALQHLPVQLLMLPAVATCRAQLHKERNKSTHTSRPAPAGGYTWDFDIDLCFQQHQGSTHFGRYTAMQCTDKCTHPCILEFHKHPHSRKVLVCNRTAPAPALAAGVPWH